METRRSTSGLSGTWMRPRVGRSRSKVTTRTKVMSTPARSGVARLRPSSPIRNDTKPTMRAAPATSNASTGGGTRLFNAAMRTVCMSIIELRVST